MTPALLWVFAALRSVRRDPQIAALALATGLALLPDVLQGGVGAPQLGYRFSLDAQPLLIALAVLASARAGRAWRRPSPPFVAAVVLAVAVNVYATIGITRGRVPRAV